MIPPEHLKLIETYNDRAPENQQLRLTLTKDKRSAVLEEFCDAVSGAAPKLRFEKKRDDDAPAPSIRVGDSLTYFAAPEGHELIPFLEAVADEGQASQLPAAVRKTLEGIRLPAPIKIYIAPRCPFCPHAVRILTPIAAAISLIQLSVIDGALFPEMAEADTVQSVPTTILDGQFRWTGTVAQAEIVNMIAHRNPLQLSPDSLENLLTEGNAGRVAEMMLENNQIFPAFLELLSHEKWPVRLGAMVAMEEIIARNRRLAARVAGPIWKRFPRLSETVQGDMAYLFGEMGEPQLIEKLEKILSGRHGDAVKEAAAEAIERIRQDLPKTARDK